MDELTTVLEEIIEGAGGSVNPSKKLKAVSESDDANVGNWLKVVDAVVEKDPAEDECPLSLFAGLGEDAVDEPDVMAFDGTVLSYGCAFEVTMLLPLLGV